MTTPQRTGSVRQRIEALFLANVGRVLLSEDIRRAARDPKTGKEPENWHQRLSELRTDYGYTIETNRDDPGLKPGEYRMPTGDRRQSASKRVRPAADTWRLVLVRAGNRCEWVDSNGPCGLAEGAIDPVGGGTVRLTPDRKNPHSVNPGSDPGNPDAWQALCGRHQVTKKNYWDDVTGELNVIAILQSVSKKQKRQAYDFLRNFFKAE